MEDNSKYENLPEASHEAVHAARNAAQALELSRQRQIDSMGDIVQERIERVLARGSEQERSIILARVPYICQDIKNINAVLSNIQGMMEQVKIDLDAKDARNESKYVNQDQFWPVRVIAYGFSGTILTAFAGGLIYLVFHLPQ